MPREYTIKDFDGFDLTVSMVDFALSKRCPRSFVFKRRDREIYALVFITDGMAEFFFADESFCAEKNDVVFIKKGDTYSFFSRGDISLEYIVISFDILPCKYLDMLPFGRFNRLGNPQRFEEMFGYVEELWYAKKVGYNLQVRSLVQSLIYELLRDSLKKEMGKKAFQNIQATADYMENYFDKVINVTDLAKLSGYSAAHYRRKFKEIYGAAPVEYLNSLRVHKAKDMLRSDLYTVGEVACRCGFGNIYYFSRVFKKITGYSPGNY